MIWNLYPMPAVSKFPPEPSQVLHNIIFQCILDALWAAIQCYDSTCTTDHFNKISFVYEPNIHFIRFDRSNMHEFPTTAIGS